jgi:hypothetical protein
LKINDEWSDINKRVEKITRPQFNENQTRRLKREKKKLNDYERLD